MTQSNWLYWKLNEGEGSAYKEYRGVDSNFEDWSIPGTTTNVYDNEGWFTPDVAAGNAVEVRDKSIDEFFNCENLVGGLFSWCNIYKTGNPANDATEVILGYGGHTNGTGVVLELLQMQWITNERAGIYLRDTSAIKSAYGAIPNDNERISLATYFDVYNMTISSWINGLTGNVNVDMSGADFPGPSDETYRGLGFLGYPNSTPGSMILHCGKNNSGLRVKNIGCVRFDYDATRQVAGLVEQVYNYPDDPPLLIGI